jgi:hypothetical protein
VNFFTFGRSEVTNNFIIATASCIFVVTVYLLGTRASVVLFPGFHFSSLVTGLFDAKFGAANILLGLTLNALLFAAAGIGARRIIISFAR